MAPACLLMILVGAGCTDHEVLQGQDLDDLDGGAPDIGLALAVDADPILSVEEAVPGVFVPPFLHCREPADDQPGLSLHTLRLPVAANGIPALVSLEILSHAHLPAAFEAP